MAKTLTAKAAISIHNNAQKAKKEGAVAYKRFVRQVIEDYGIEKNDAFRIANGDDMLQIVAKYEQEVVQNEM